MIYIMIVWGFQAVEVETPQEFQGSVIGLLSKRRGQIREALIKEHDVMTVYLIDQIPNTILNILPVIF